MKYSKDQYEKSKSKEFIDCECDYCNASFKRKKHDLYVSLKRNQTELFCSKRCSYDFISKKYDYDVLCKTCGNKVEYPKIFCNHKCSAVFNNKRRESVKEIKKISNCILCNDSVEVSRHCSKNNTLCDKCKAPKKEHYHLEKRIKKSKCIVCEIEFEHIQRNKKTCSVICKNIATNRGAVKGGRKSVFSQQKRSKNEIYFYDLCKCKFANVLHNEQMFNGWDADVILPDLKIAILWNGVWHYKKVHEKHSLKKQKIRDRLKIKEIQKLNFIPYVIKDLGSFDVKKVEMEFQIFCKWLNDNKLL
jgi:hypothetical protein